jgi:hypothetical protein
MRTLAYGIPLAYEIWQHFSGTKCVLNGSRYDCNDFFVFSFTVLRGASYSLTAWFVSSIQPLEDKV